MKDCRCLYFSSSASFFSNYFYDEIDVMIMRHSTLCTVLRVSTSWKESLALLMTELCYGIVFFRGVSDIEYNSILYHVTVCYEVELLKHFILNLHLIPQVDFFLNFVVVSYTLVHTHCLRNRNGNCCNNSCIVVLKEQRNSVADFRKWQHTNNNQRNAQRREETNKTTKGNKWFYFTYTSFKKWGTPIQISKDI